MNRVLCLVLFFLSIINFADAGRGDRKVEDAEAEYILTLTIFRSVSHEIIERAVSDEFLKMSGTEQLAVLQSDPDVHVVETVLRMVFGQCQSSTLINMQYAKLQDDGTYALVRSAYSHGTLADFTYHSVEGFPDQIKLTGICKVGESLGRAEFKPFPALDVGKPEGDFGGGFKAGSNGRPLIINLNETSVVQIYSRSTEVVLTTMKVERAKKWRGDVNDIVNPFFVWDASDPNPPEGGGIWPHLIITGK